jgi:hypothetical protein
MRNRASIVEKFNSYNFHDDTIHTIKIFPSSYQKKSGKYQKTPCKIEIDFTDYLTEKRGVLVLKVCANISLQVDFDVLLQNGSINTAAAAANGNGIEIKSFIENQKPFWNVEYAAPLNEPIVEKLQNIDEYVLFRIQLFGGIIEVVAKDYELRNLPK